MLRRKLRVHHIVNGISVSFEEARIVWVNIPVNKIAESTDLIAHEIHCLTSDSERLFRAVPTSRLPDVSQNSLLRFTRPSDQQER